VKGQAPIDVEQVMNWLDVNGFRGTLVTNVRDEGEILAAATDYKRMLLCVLDAILRRFERNRDYPFIDTKLSLLTGKDFAADDPLRGKNVIYGWIQGRGLEALAGHVTWLRRQRDIEPALRESLEDRALRMVRQVAERMEMIRERNRGRLFFMMTPQGKPLSVTAEGRVVPREIGKDLPTSMNDMFYCKGLVAAGRVLEDDALVREACALFGEVYHDVTSGRFYSDQQQMDPRNPMVPVPGRFSHGGRMIGIGAAARFLESTGDSAYERIGIELMKHILGHHVKLSGQGEYGEQFDMFEFVDADMRPFLQNGELVSDPGHATEFVGLSLKFLAMIEGGETDAAQIDAWREILLRVLRKNFRNGFVPGLGIVKRFDLATRRATNDQMPWWSLPETMRAAILARTLTQAVEREEFARMAADCSNAFLTHYVRRQLGLMAVQTLNADGTVADVVPATPDADPGYHTGLSVIDCLNVVDAAFGGRA
jgi:hypothetical protein